MVHLYVEAHRKGHYKDQHMAVTVKKIAGWGVLDIDKNTNHKMRPPALKKDQERDMCLGHP